MKINDLVNRASNGLRQIDLYDLVDVTISAAVGFAAGWGRVVCIGLANPALAGLAVGASLASASFFAAASRPLVHVNGSAQEKSIIRSLRFCCVGLIVAAAPLALFAMGALSPLWLGVCLGALALITSAQIIRII